MRRTWDKAYIHHVSSSPYLCLDRAVFDAGLPDKRIERPMRVLRTIGARIDAAHTTRQSTQRTHGRDLAIMFAYGHLENLPVSVETTETCSDESTQSSRLGLAEEVMQGQALTDAYDSAAELLISAAR